jgi:hypothetical protein
MPRAASPFLHIAVINFTYVKAIPNVKQVKISDVLNPSENYQGVWQKCMAVGVRCVTKHAVVVLSDFGSRDQYHPALFCSARDAHRLNPCQSSLPDNFLLYFQDAFWMLIIGLYRGLHTVQDVFVHNQLAILANFDFESVHRSWSWSLKIHPALVITASMTRALEFILSR